MTCGNMQIVTAYEECGMTPEQISSDLGYDISAVKAILLQYSSKYSDQFITKSNISDAEKQENEETFDKEDLELAKRTIRSLARDGEMEGVRLKAAQYIIDERKGRNDIRALKETRMNIVVINEQIQRARAQMKIAEEAGKKQAELAQNNGKVLLDV